MPRNIVMRLVWLFLLCLGVGLLLTALNVHPRELITNFDAIISNGWHTVKNFFGWAWDYVALGAWIVIPVVIIMAVSSAMKRRKS